MLKTLRMLTLSASVVAVTALVGLSTTTYAADENKVSEEDIAKGKELAFNRGKGNCLACHMMDDGQMAGNIGPPLVAMKARYPERDKLRAQIYEPRTKNPNTIMIPYGSHGVLSDAEIDLITDYVHSL